MKTVYRSFVFAAVVATLATALPEIAAAQDLHPSRRPSPMGMARTTLDDTYVRVVYSRPYVRGRDNIFGTEDSGALVPYGQIWRTGANEATEITVTDDVMVAGETLPAGTYSLFTTPGADEWKVHFNSALGLNGTMRFDMETRSGENAYMAENDVVTVTATPTELGEDDTVDQLTISFESVDDGAHMILRWADTEVRVPFSAP